MSITTRRRALLWLVGFLGVSAVLGGLALLIGWIPLPEELLEGSPFSTYVIPSWILIVIGLLALGAFLSLRGGQQFGALLSALSGIAIIIFEIVEMWVIGLNWLQFIYLAVGVAVLLLSAPLLRSSFEASEESGRSVR